MISILTKPFTQGGRQNFLYIVDSEYEKYPLIQEYESIIVDNFGSATEVLNTYEAHNPMDNALKYKHMTDHMTVNLSEHMDYQHMAERLSERLFEIPIDKAEIITYYATHYEPFTLVTMEPFILPIVGGIIFFKTFGPLHREGAFKYLMKDCLERRKQFHTTLSFQTVWKSMKTYDIKPIVTKAIEAMEFGRLVGNSTFSLLGVLATIAKMYVYFFPIVTLPTTPLLKDSPDTTTCKKVVDDYYGQTRGLQSKQLDLARGGFEKICYEVGRGLSGGTRSLLDGVASRWEGPAKAIADKIDETVAKKDK